MSREANDSSVQYRIGSDDGFDNGCEGDHEEVPMIEKGIRAHRRKWNLAEVPRASNFTTLGLGLLLLASLFGNAVLLSQVLRTKDLDHVCVKHTSEYCE